MISLRGDVGEIRGAQEIARLELGRTFERLDALSREVEAVKGTINTEIATVKGQLETQTVLLESIKRGVEANGAARQNGASKLRRSAPYVGGTVGGAGLLWYVLELVRAFISS